MKSRHDLPLKNDIAARFVPQIVAAMVYLGTLCFVFALFILHTTYTWEKDLNTDLSVEISPLAEVPLSSLQSQVMTLLDKTPGVQKATVVPQQDLSTLVTSLLGDDSTLDQFSLPVIIDVTLDGTEKVDTKRLGLLLKNISPSIHLIDHQQWQGQVANLLHTSLLLACLITLLIMSIALIDNHFCSPDELTDPQASR